MQDAGIQRHRGVDKSHQQTIRPAKLSADRSQRGAKQRRQLDAWVVDVPYLDQRAEVNAAHHRNDVAQVFAEGAKSDDGQNAAHRRAVDRPAGNQNIQGSHNAQRPHIKQGNRQAVHQYKIRYQTAGMTVDALDALLVLDTKPPHRHQDKGQCQNVRDDNPVVFIGPAQAVVDLVAKGFHDRDQQRPHQARGKADVIEVVALVHTQAVGGQRRQHEADDDATKHHRQQFLPVVSKLQGDLGDHRREGRPVQGDVDILGKALPLETGKKVDAKDDRPDVGDIFAEHRKAGHQKDAGDGGPAKHDAAQL